MENMKNVLIGDRYLVDFSQRQIVDTKSDQTETMEPRLQLLLEKLIEKRGAPATRNELVASIWGSYGSGNELLTHSVSRLRRHFRGCELIKTIPKVGYAFEGTISQPQAASSPQSAWTPATITTLALLVVAALLVVKAMIWPHH